MLNARKKFEIELEDKIINLMVNNEFSDMIFLCIGTSKIIGDAIGPILGSNLKDIENEFIHIYGTIENNLHFNNTKNIIESINRNYINPCIVSIDAALSNNNSIGDIVIGKGFIKLGKALDKNFGVYSDVNIKCIVGSYYEDREKNLKILNKVSTEEIIKTSNIVSEGIRNVLKKLENYYKIKNMFSKCITENINGKTLSK